MATGMSNGPNARPLEDTISETGPGLADDAVLDGELSPGELEKGSAQAVEALRRRGWAPAEGADQGSAEDESEAHPS